MEIGKRLLSGKWNALGDTIIGSPIYVTASFVGAPLVHRNIWISVGVDVVDIHTNIRRNLFNDIKNDSEDEDSWNRS